MSSLLRYMCTISLLFLSITGCDVREGNASDVVRWYSQAFSYWDQNPFPTNCIVSMRGTERTWRDRVCWIRIEFRPEFQSEISQNLANLMSAPSNGGLRYSQSTGAYSGAGAVDAPDYWTPQEFGKTCVEYHVSRNIGAGQGDTSIMVLIISNAKPGLAFICCY